MAWWSFNIFISFTWVYKIMKKLTHIFFFSLFIIILFIFFSYTLFYKSDMEAKLSTSHTKGRVVNNIDVDIITDNSNNNLNNKPKEKLFDYIKDNKINVVHFWATWCSACLAEHEYLKSYAKANKDINISVLYKDNISNVAYANVKEIYKANFIDSKGFIALEFGVSGVPESFIVDNNGKILEHIIGSIDKMGLK